MSTSNPPVTGMYTPPANDGKPDRSLVVWGWIATLCLPIAGFVIGIILWSKGNPGSKGHGIAQTLVSGGWMLLWALIFAIAIVGAGAAAVEASDAYTACIDQAQTVAQLEKC